MKKVLLIAVALIYSFCIRAEEAPTVTSVLYWIDTNYFAAITENQMEFDVQCSDLTIGLHFLHMRVSDSNGNYSQLYEYGFLKLAETTKPDSIQSLQYWWNDLSDNAVVAPYQSTVFTLSTDALPYGLHSLKYRVKDNLGKWSELNSHYFYKGEVVDSARIVSYSYWWNDLAEQVTTEKLETPVSAFVIEEDLTVPHEARTNYSGHYTATLNLLVSDNHGKSAFITSDVEYPDNDAPSTEIDASVYITTVASGVNITWTELSNDKMGDYNVYVSKDDGPFYLWLPDTTTSNSKFYGEAGSTYRFTVTGRDVYGNREQYDESKCVSVTFE